MFGMFRSKSDQRVVDGGCVPCPRRGTDVEMDVCIACRWLVEIDDKSAVPVVRCAPRRLLPADWRPVFGP